MRRIRIDLNHDNFHHFLKAESYCSLRTIILRGGVTDTQIDKIKDVLRIVENIHMNHCTIHGDIHEKFFKFCSKVKQLIFWERWERSYEEPPRRLFFQQIFTSLEYFEYIHSPFYPESNEIHSFLERYQNVKHFGIDVRQLWLNRDSFINSNIQLDCLNVHYNYNENDGYIPFGRFHVKLGNDLFLMSSEHHIIFHHEWVKL